MHIFSNYLKDSLQIVLSKCSLSDIGALAQTCRAGRTSADLAKVAKVFSETMPYLDTSSKPLNTSSEPLNDGRKLEILTRDIRNIIRNYPENQISQDVSALLTSEAPLSIHEILFLKKFARARDTLVIWKELEEQIRAPCCDLKSVFDSAENVINK